MEVTRPNRTITQVGCKLIIKDWVSIHLDQRIQRIAEMAHNRVKLEVIREMSLEDKKVRQV